MARISGSRIKVKQIVLAMRAENLGSDDIYKTVYPHLSPAKVYAALTYYYDHQQQVDAQIEADHEFVEQWMKDHPNHITRAELERRMAAKRETA